MPGTTSYVSLKTPRPLYSFNHVVIFRFNGPIFFGNETKFKSKYVINHGCYSHALNLCWLWFAECLDICRTPSVSREA